MEGIIYKHRQSMQLTKTNRMYEKTSWYPVQFKPRLNWINYLFEPRFKFLSKPLETKNTERNTQTKTTCFFLKKRTQLKSKIQKHLIKKSKKLNLKKDSAQSDRENILPQLAYPTSIGRPEYAS